jgi:hypothetical protein
MAIFMVWQTYMHNSIVYTPIILYLVTYLEKTQYLFSKFYSPKASGVHFCVAFVSTRIKPQKLVLAGCKFIHQSASSQQSQTPAIIFCIAKMANDFYCGPMQIQSFTEQHASKSKTLYSVFKALANELV